MEFFLFPLVFSFLGSSIAIECGPCDCFPLLQTIICEGREIIEINSLPLPDQSYSQVVIRGTSIIKLPEDICRWNLREIFMRDNSIFQCVSISYCENTVYDTDCYSHTQSSMQNSSDFLTSTSIEGVSIPPISVVISEKPEIIGTIEKFHERERQMETLVLGIGIDFDLEKKHHWVGKAKTINYPTLASPTLTSRMFSPFIWLILLSTSLLLK